MFYISSCCFMTCRWVYSQKYEDVRQWIPVIRNFLIIEKTKIQGKKQSSPTKIWGFKTFLLLENDGIEITHLPLWPSLRTPRSGAKVKVTFVKVQPKLSAKHEGNTFLYLSVFLVYEFCWKLPGLHTWILTDPSGLTFILYPLKMLHSYVDFYSTLL